MLITQRGGRRRALASLLTGALVAGLTFVGVAPAGAAADTVSGGSATWNFTDGWTGYVTGPIAKGTVTPAMVDGKSVYKPASGSLDAAGTGTVRFAGSTTYSGHDGALGLTISDLTLRLTSPTAGVLTADFGGTINAGTGNDAKVADVTVAPTRTGDTLTLVASGTVSNDLAAVSDYFSAYVGKPMSTLTATLDAPLPVAPAATTSTTLAVSPGGTSVEGTALALSATVAPAAAGAVEFFDGATSLGTATVSDGVARRDVTPTTVGERSFTARFTPADAAAFTASTSAGVAHTVTAKQVDPPAPVADPQVTVTPNKDVDPAVANTFTISGTGFVGAGAKYGAYVLLGETSLWSGGSALPGTGWLQQAFVPAALVKDGAFTTTITVPAGTLDASKSYQVATSAAHGLSVTDRSLDTLTPITLQGEEPQAPVFEPKVEVFAADGKTPLGNTVVRPGDEIVVKGTGFDPASNVGGRGAPIPANLPQGSYVVFGSFAKDWQPSTGAPSSARKAGPQAWALAESVLDQVPPQYQGAIRKDWVNISADGSFTAKLKLTTLDAIEGGTFGVYTYAAGGMKNAAQEKAVVVNFTNAPAPVFEPKVEVFAADGKTPLGNTVVRPGDEIVVKGTGFDPASNVGGYGNPIPKTLPQGNYVVFGAFAESWKPSAGATGAARKVGSQVWALSETVLEQLTPTNQAIIRAQWVDITAEGSFTARLTLKAPAALEGGRFGVYTYGAGGVTNAAQELSVPVNFTEKPAPGPLTIAPGLPEVVPGGKQTLTVDGLGEGDKVQSVLIDGAPATFSSTGAALTVSVPRSAPAGTTTVTVVSALGAHGEATFTIVKPTVTVTPSGDVDPSVANTFTITGSGFVGAGASNGTYVLLGDAAIWKGEGPLVAAGWLQLAHVASIVDGKFTKTITVPAGSFDPSKDYVVATSAAHGLSITDRTLDTFSPIRLTSAAPVAVKTATTLTAASAEVALGAAAELAATVTPTTATGTVEFLRGDSVVARIPVVQGKAAIGVPTSVLGPVQFSARFVPADAATFEPSASQTVTVTAVEGPPVDATLPVGDLQWGVKESFRTYITGGIAKGGAVASAGATVKDGTFDFRQTGGSWKPGTLLGTAEYGGTVTFSGHDGLLNLTLSNPTVDVTSPGKGTLVVDVRSANLDGTTFDAKRVRFASLALNGAIEHESGSVTYVNVATTLTDAGSKAFSGFYPAGTELDPLFFVMGANSTSGGGTGGSIGTPNDGSGTTTVDPAKATLSTYQVVPGGKVTISGVGFGANEAGLKSVIRSTPRTLATGVTANAGGAASATVTIPKNLEPGEHTLSLEGANHKVSAIITVTGTTSTSGGSAAQQCYAQGVNGATLSWGVSDAFRAYIAGPIAKGSVSTSGVKDNGSSYTWSGGKGSFNTDLGKGRTSFAGSVKFTGHDGILDLQISNPRVQVDGGSGTLIVDVVSSDMQGNKSTSKGVAFASLNLSGKKSTSGSTITWTGASATLTAAGAKAFAGFYEPGTALAPVTFSFPVGGDVECDVHSGLADTGADSATVAAFGVMLLLGGAGLLAASKRRRARVDA
ncbi:HtaA domain-containing protein [Oerskovia paurometabola]|uniref:HtaA domain-containing protein n=1 Tax=Oerskovia paurometabola TaxID=162170 RepID=A0ABW1X672_9CELL|nr:HtaA domain-containing protein [Oerskovia paurometabola]MBM7495901.1 LPXTG-motif cell wall-anchored protein [Oerskovia paurometabola]